MIEKKVLQKINENKIGIKDILTRKKFWKNPTQEGYRDLVLWIGWKHWTQEYNFLPIPDKFLEIQKETLEQLKEKPKESYFIIRNTDGVLTIVLQNPRSYDFLDNRNVLFFGNDTENTKPFLYWITSVDYANNETLFCQITAERDPIWAYYGNFVNSRGTARILASQLGMEHSCPTFGGNVAVPVGGAIVGALVSEEKDCLACEWCYDFCGDLRIKKAKPGVEEPKPDNEEPAIAPWQPKWGVVYIDPCDMALAPDGFNLPDAEITLASGFTLRQWSPDVGTIKTLLPKMDTPYLLFLVNKQHWEKCASESLPFDVEEFTKDKGNPIQYPLPDIYNQQPHLLNHSSAQFFFQKKLVETANLKHAEVKKINGKYHLFFDLTIRSSIAGILYQFQSKEIFFRIELKVQGAFSNNKALKLMINILKGAWAGVQSTLGNIISGIPLIGGVGRAMSSKGKETKEALKTKPPTGKELTEQLLGGEMLSDDHPEREQQTERMKKSTAKNIARIVEPAIFYSNTIDFNYDFWEFANRNVVNPFEIRFEHSDMLYNNLANSNNKSPLQNMSCRYSAFKQLIKVGDFRAEVNPWWDYQGFWKNVCGSGVFFYDDLEQLFKPWKPIFKLTESYTFGSLADIANIVGEEEIIEIDRDEKVASGQTGDVGYAHSTFLRTTNKSQLPLLKNVQGCSSDWSDEFGWCWGCFSHGINTHGGEGTEFECQGTFDPTEDTDIEFFLKKNDQVQRQVASCKAGNSYKVVLKRTGSTIDIYFRFKEKDVRYKAEIKEIDHQKTYESKEFVEPEWTDDKTQFNSLIGEVDPEGFEGEPPEQETEQQQEWDKPEKELKETSGEAEQEWEKEKEREAEREKEAEKERELEREAEREREREQEKELELEREKQRDRETQAEREKRQRDAQWEQDKKDRERLEREARTREREAKRREQRQKDKEKKEKERKERE